MAPAAFARVKASSAPAPIPKAPDIANDGSPPNGAAMTAGAVNPRTEPNALKRLKKL